LNERRLRGNRDRLGCRTNRQRQPADIHAVADADDDAGASHRVETVKGDFNGVGVGREARHDEVAGRSGEDRGDLGTARFADHGHGSARHR
jgi:hypothetical protein